MLELFQLNSAKIVVVVTVVVVDVVEASLNLSSFIFLSFEMSIENAAFNLLLSKWVWLAHIKQNSP